MLMDLITIALARKNGSSGGDVPIEEIIPSIGENGNWWVHGKDTGISAKPKDVEVDGTLKVDTENQKIIVIKDDIETIVGEYTSNIKEEDIVNLFIEEGN